MKFTVDKTVLTSAFNEWMRRYVKEPDRFAKEFPAGEYGPAAAEYLIKLLPEVSRESAQSRSQT